MNPAIDGDCLSRTTLSIDGSPPDGAIVGMLHALRHVPGVLLADIDTARSGAVVAHDAAVPANAMVGAARDAGVQVRIVDDVRTQASASRVSPVYPLAMRELLIVALVVVAVLSLIDVFVPSPGQKHAMIIVATVATWGFFLMTSFGALR